MTTKKTRASRLRMGIMQKVSIDAAPSIDVTATAASEDRWVVIATANDGSDTAKSRADPLGLFTLASSYKRRPMATSVGAVAKLIALGWARVVGDGEPWDDDPARLEVSEIVLAAIASARGERATTSYEAYSAYKAKPASFAQGDWPARDFASLEIWVRYCLRLNEADRALLLLWFLEDTLTIENLDEMLGSTAALLRGGVHAKLMALGLIFCLDVDKAKSAPWDCATPSGVVCFFVRERRREMSRAR